MLCPWQSHPSSIGMLHFCEQQTRRIEEDVFWITPFIYYVQYNTYDTTLQLLIIIMFKTHFLQTHRLYLSRSVNPFSLTDLASQLSSSISRRRTTKKSFFNNNNNPNLSYSSFIIISVISIVCRRYGRMV